MSVRLHVPDAREGIVTIEGARVHYLTRVLRLVVGDPFEAFDGRGHAHDATVTALSEDSATLTLGPARAAAKARHISVVQGLPKADKFELILQKCTELGATEFVPAAMTRSIVKLADDRAEKKTERWQRICEEAARQCGRSDVPLVRAPMSLQTGIGVLPEGSAILILDEEETTTPLQLAAMALEPGQPVAIVVGPEGGVDRAEVESLRALGAQSVSLGRRILRTETAALVALSVIQLLDGELG